MTATEFTDSELWTLMFALRDKYLTQLQHRDLCRKHAGLPQINARLAPEQFARFAVQADDKLAEIDGIVAKLPEHLRTAFAQSIAEESAGAVA